MNSIRFRRIVVGAVLVVCAMTVQGSSCLPNLNEPVDKVADTLNNAIGQLGSESTAWRGTLQQLEQDLIQQGQSTLANQVQSVLNRGIAAAGLEVKCTVSFLKAQLREQLQGILAAYLHKPVPPPVPHFCSYDPPQIDLRITGSARPLLNVYGFNLSNSNVSVAVVNGNGARTAVQPGYFNVGTEFMATMNTVNYPFTVGSLYVSFTLTNGEEQRIGVVQAASCGGIDQPCCTVGTACNPGSGCLNSKCVTCPPYTPPQQPQIQTLLDRDDFDGNNCGGVNNLHTYGGPCAAGTQRQQCLVTLKTTNSQGTSCRFESWGSSNSRDCTCNVRFISDKDCFHGITCTIKITETVDQPPPPPHPSGCP
jgi:hypothetical protein